MYYEGNKVCLAKNNVKIIYWHAKVSLHKRNTNIFQNKDHRETKFLCTKRPSVKLAGQPIFAGWSARGVWTGAYLEKHVRSV